MPATTLNNLRPDDDTARAIAEALNSTEQLQKNNNMNNPVQEYETPKDYPTPSQPRQYQQVQQPQYQPPPPREYKQPEPQYQHPPEEYYMQNYPQEQIEQFQNTKKNSNINIQLPEFLKKSLMLFMILLLLNNDFFKQILSHIPGTLDIEGEYTFLLTILLCFIITLVYSLFNHFL